MRIIYTCLLSSIVLFFSSGAYATISCTVSSSGLNFGGYNIQSASPLTSTGSITITCTRGSPFDPTTVNYSVSLNTGLSGTYNSRQLGNGAARLNYNIYTASNFTQIWGNGTSSTSTVTGNIALNISGSTSRILTAFGQVPALQVATPGNYNDTITMTLTY